MKSPPATQGKHEKQRPLYSLSCYLPVLFESQTSPSSSTLHPSFSDLVLFQGMKNVGTVSLLKKKQKRELLVSLEYSRVKQLHSA